MKAEFNFDDPKHISIRNLYYGSDNFKKNDEAERWLIYGINYNTTLDTLEDNGKKGFFPFYDAILKDGNDTQIEIKFSLSENFPFEVSKGDGSQGGLSITTAEYYITVNPGWSRLDGVNNVPVGKVRMIPTKDIREYVTKNQTDIKISGDSDDISQSSRKIDINFWDLPTHVWLYDVPLLYWCNSINPIGFDLNVNNILKTNPHYKK